jgi:hypothetical protein
VYHGGDFFNLWTERDFNDADGGESINGGILTTPPLSCQPLPRLFSAAPRGTPAVAVPVLRGVEHG